MTIAGSIKLFFDDEGDGSGKLRAKFNADGYAGHSEAYFTLAELKAFTIAIAHYPLPAGLPVCIRGGYWQPGEMHRLDQEHLYLALPPVGRRGAVRLNLRVAQPFSAAFDGVRYSACVHFDIDYAAVDNLARALTSLWVGDVEHVLLEHLQIAA